MPSNAQIRAEIRREKRAMAAEPSMDDRRGQSRQRAASHRNEPSLDRRRGQSAARSKSTKPSERRKRSLTQIAAASRPRGLTVTDPSKIPAAQKLGRPQRRRAGLPVVSDVVGAGRAVGHTIGAVAETTASNPGRAAGKTATQAGEIVKGLAGAAIGLPVYAATYPVGKVLGNAGDSPVTIGKNMLKAEVDRVARTYGPSYKGQKGAYKKLKKQVREEGPLMPALDVATVLAPASIGTGAAVRSGAAGSRLKAATASRPDLRRGVTDSSSKAQKPRKSALGMATASANDAARKVAQRAARARAQKRLRVRAVERVTRKPLPATSILHAEPRGLAPHRAALKPGEVAPLSNRRARRTQNLDVATEHRRGKDRAKLRTQQHVTGREGDTLATSMRQVPEELHDVVWWARTHGVRDAAGARKMVALRRAEIERSQAAALAGAGKQGKADRKAAVVAEKKGEGELALLRRIEESPSVVERADVRAAVEREVARGRRVVTEREGLEPSRAASGRAKLAGATIGVKRADEINAERAAARDAARAEAKTAIKQAVAERDKTRATAARVLAGARADLAKATGRAEILSRNVTGRQQRGKSFAGGAHGVNEAKRALAKAQDRAAEALDAANTKVVAARAAHKEASAPIKRESETPEQYEARVVAAHAERGLAPPEHMRSTFDTDPDDLRIRRNVQPGAPPKNPLAKERKGTLRRLGQEDFSTPAVADTLSANLRRGARMDAEAAILEKHGLYFKGGPDEARRFAEGLGMNLDQIDLIRPSTGMVRKGSEGASVKAKDQAGDFAKIEQRGVFLVPKHVADQLDALDAKPTPAGDILRKLGQFPQGAILALSPSWFGFQRVNDIIASTLGGSILTQAHYADVLKKLDPDSREVVTVLSGRGSMASEFLGPTSGQKLGRMARVLDENPTLRDALKSDTPATNLLTVALAKGPTALLRADAKITGGVRERQFLHNLARAGSRMDADVKTATRGLGPFGQALKTGDVQLMEKLLKDPQFHRARDEAVEALTRVHGDWHNYTAAERRFKSAFAFYGFLRYATRMALYTLPVNHPHVGLLVAQLGATGTEYAKSVIGPDMPYKLGAVYNKDGTVAADFSRANPLAGPLFSMTKPEHAAGLLAPPVGVALSYLIGQPIGLSDSSTGYVAKYDVRGDPSDHAVGGFGGDPRLRIAARGVLSWLYPFRAWQDSDKRPQSHDSLPFSRRPLVASTPAERIKIEDKKAEKPGGVGELAHEIAPFLGIGSKENVGAKGKRITAAKQQRASDERLRQAKRRGAQTPLGQVKLDIETEKERFRRERKEMLAEFEEIKRELEIERAEMGLGR